MFRNRFIIGTILLSSILLSGCGGRRLTPEEREAREPLIKQGEAYMEVGDYTHAEAAFLKALEKDPLMARPCYDLARIYHHYKPDYISAIYYYRRYLALRPDAENADKAREELAKAQGRLADAILDQSGASGALREIRRLRAENETLRRKIAELERAVAARRPAATAAEKINAPLPDASSAPPAAAKPLKYTAHRIYTVRKGDTLSKIAKKFYGKPDYRPIYEANKDRMRSPSDLKVGQTLVIPMPPER